MSDEAIPLIDKPISIAEAYRRAFDFSKLEGELPASPAEIQEVFEELRPQWIQHNAKLIREGIQAFIEAGAESAAQRIRRRLRRMRRTGIIPTEKPICSDNDWARLSNTAREAFDAGREEQATAMYTVLQSLRPWEGQPHVHLFTIIWRHEGVQVAADCYRLMAPVMVDPVFFYFAADCFLNAEDRPAAREAIDMSRTQLGNQEINWEIGPQLAQEIEAFYQELWDDGPANLQTRV